MYHEPLPNGLTLDLEEPSLLVVTGADIRAEAFDRPTAYALAAAANMLLSRAAAVCGQTLAAAVVCSDVWYLNNSTLRLCPVVSVGGPEVNALSAFLIARVPPVLSVDGQYAVHHDVSCEQLCACVWGIDAPNTALAIDYFCQRLLSEFVGACVPTDK